MLCNVHILSGAGRRKSDHRFFRICPVAGCRSRPQKKLSQHIDYKHPELVAQKRQLLYVAKCVPRQRRRKKCANQPTLLQVLDRQSTSPRRAQTPPDDDFADDTPPDKDLELSEVEQGGIGCSRPTRIPQELCNVHSHLLRSLSTPRTALKTRQIALEVNEGGVVDVKTRIVPSTVLKTRQIALEVNEGGVVDVKTRIVPSTVWDRLSDRDQLVGYLEKLKRSSIGPEGQLAKVDGICCALRFLRVEVLKGAPHPESMEKAGHMLEVLQGWKSTLRKQKRKLRKKRLEELSCQDLSLDEVNGLIENAELWRKFESVCSRAQRDETISTSILDDATILLAASIL